MAYWSELHTDFLGLIAKRLNLYEDFVAFAGVCSSWRSVASKANFTSSPQVPWLMLSESEKNESDTRGFFSISKGMVREHILPEVRRKRCFTSHGWIMTFDTDLSLSLLNPITRVQIPLPHYRTFTDHYPDGYTSTELQEFYIEKFVLSSSPSWTSYYTVMVVHGNRSRLAFARPGDETWTTINTWTSMYLDVAFYNGQFYAVNAIGHVMVFDVQGPNPKEGRIVSALPQGLLNAPQMEYLVEASGALLLVSRYFSDDYQFLNVDTEQQSLVYRTIEFRVFELDLSNDGKWTELKSLGDKALFLGLNSSVSLTVSDFPGCKSNCIYFTDDHGEGLFLNRNGAGKDMGIFNLKDTSIELHYKGDSCCISRLSPPMWIIPIL